jgi:hypothetical protein
LLAGSPPPKRCSNPKRAEETQQIGWLMSC